MKANLSVALVKEFADEPHVAEGVEDGTLKHSANGLRAECFVLVLADGAVFGGAGSDGLAVYCGGVINEKFDAHGGETGGRRRARAVLR